MHCCLQHAVGQPLTDMEKEVLAQEFRGSDRPRGEEDKSTLIQEFGYKEDVDARQEKAPARLEPAKIEHNNTSVSKKATTAGTSGQ